MSISFLYPLAWIAAVGIAAPIWLHLQRRAEKNLVRFSAMQFLDEQPVARSQPLWPRNWWLLALRLLALILLVTAFAWPYLPQEQPAEVIRESRVYILDNTLSHQASGAFDRARDELSDELRSATPDIQVAVIELTNTPNVIVRFGDDRTAAAETVRKLEPSHQRGSYLAAFRAAASLLEKSLGKVRRIELLGDSQANQWEEGLQSPPFLERVEVSVPEIPDGTVTNVAVAEPIVQRLIAGEMAVAECAVRVAYQGQPQPLDIVFLENGQEMLRRTIDLAGEPESSTLLAQWRTDPTQWLRGEVKLEMADDSLAADNRAFFSLAPLREGTVAVLSRSLFVRAGLAPDVMAGRWKAQFPDETEIDRSNQTVPLADVLWVESSFLETNAARMLTKQYLSRGRGVVLVVDLVSTQVAGFLHDLGISVDSAGSAEPSATGFRYTLMDHPVFQPFRSPDFGDLAKIRVERFHSLAVEHSVSLVYAESGDPLVLESTQPAGKLFVLAFSLDRTETNWPLDPSFVPFLDRLLTAAKAEPEATTTFEPGEACAWTVADADDVQEVVVSLDEREVLRAPVEKHAAQFTLPDRPGHYGLHYRRSSPTADGVESLELQTVLDVNPSPAESQLKYAREVPALAAWKRTSAEADRSMATRSAVEQLALTRPEILRQKVWWWLVVAGLVALCIETAWVTPQREQS